MAAERVGDGGAPDGGAAEGGAESEADRGAAEDVVTVHQHASTDSSPFSSPDLGWSLCLYSSTLPHTARSRLHAPCACKSSCCVKLATNNS